MRKKVLQMLSVIAMMFVLNNIPVYAQESEVIPMDQLDINENAQGEEDGEPLVDEILQKEEDSKKMVVFRYLSSGVDSTYYAATEVQGIDVSRHQRTVNWSQVKACGMNFAIIRVGYRGYEGGQICADEYFQSNIVNASNAGLKVGVYFFSQAINEQEAREEASYVVQMIQKYNIQYPVVFDWETAAGYRTNRPFTKAQMNAMADAFCQVVSSAGYIPMVYSNTTDFQNRFDYDSLASKYYIWYARYPARYGGSKWYGSGDPLPNYDNNIDFNIWQYMSDGAVPGVNGNCDVNVSFLDFGTVRQPDPVEIPLTSSSDKITIDNVNHQIIGMEEDDIYNDLRSVFPNFYVSINGSGASGSENVRLKTGDQLVFSPKTPYTYLKNDTYTLVIKGDVDKNGRISILDMQQIQKYILGLDTLDPVQTAAAQLSGRGELSILDMQQIQKHILGLKNLCD